MGPAGMSSSVTSVRSGSELSDSDMESSTHSLASFTQVLRVFVSVWLHNLNIWQKGTSRDTFALVGA